MLMKSPKDLLLGCYRVTHAVINQQFVDTRNLSSMRCSYKTSGGRFCEPAPNLRRLALDCPDVEEDELVDNEGFPAWLVSIRTFLFCPCSLTVCQGCPSNLRALKLLELLVLPQGLDCLDCMYNDNCDRLDSRYPHWIRGSQVRR
jgi:hypothetical protein